MQPVRARSVLLQPLLLRSVLTVLLMTTSGCGILFGNVKPVAEKSDRYRVMDLATESKDWEKLSTKQPDGDPAAEADAADIAYQSRKTASIISLNSACRNRIEEEKQDLKTITAQLLLGFSEVTLREEKPLTLDNNPALQTTVRGKLNGEQTELRAVVIRREDCIYDLMYIARPQQFPLQETDFSRFVESLRLR